MSLSAIAIPSLPENPVRDPAQFLVVGLHGWGANARDLATLAPYMDLADTQMIFPDAPFPHPYAPGGKMWYGFPANFSFQNTPEFGQNVELVESRQHLIAWIEGLDAQTGIPLQRTVLAGFSQGGAMTLDIGFGLPLAGLVVMSGYLHAPLSIRPDQPTSPVFMVHGRQDPVVPLAAAQQARDALNAAGVAVDYQEFNMGHEIQPMALAQIRSFVQKLQAETIEKT